MLINLVRNQLNSLESVVHTLQEEDLLVDLHDAQLVGTLSAALCGLAGAARVTGDCAQKYDATWQPQRQAHPIRTYRVAFREPAFVD